MAHAPRPFMTDFERWMAEIVLSHEEEQSYIKLMKEEAMSAAQALGPKFRPSAEFGAKCYLFRVRLVYQKGRGWWLVDETTEDFTRFPRLKQNRGYRNLWYAKVKNPTHEQVWLDALETLLKQREVHRSIYGGAPNGT